MLIATLLFLGKQVFAQPAEQFPIDPAKFITEFVAKMNATRNNDAKDLMPLLQKQWNGDAYSEKEKSQVISQINVMLQKKSQLFPEVYYYARAIFLLKSQDTYIKFAPKEFFDVSEKCIKDMEARRLRVYLKALCDYIPQGNTCKRNKFVWNSSQTQPKLYYLEVKDDKETYKAPVIQFKKTDLHFVGEFDSTLIKQTSGEFNLLTRGFMGYGGIIDWAKMDIPSAYVQLKRFHINFNSSAILADSVTFYYPKMIANKPIIGHFEDKNMGYKDINKAAFPYFKSYGGGVTIENLIQNVSYQGGFSLKGTRTIGSSYDTLVKYVAPKPIVKKKKPKPVVVKNETTPEEPVAEEPKYEIDFSEWGIEEMKEEEVHNDDPVWVTTEEAKAKEEFSPDAVEGDSSETYIAKPSYNTFDEMITKRIPAKVTFSRSGKKAVTFSGDEFILDQKTLTGRALEVYIYLGENDTLMHPGVELQYTTGDKELMIKRPTKGTFSRQPFYSTFHDFYLSFETILWQIGSDNVRFTSFIDQANKESVVESADFFSQVRFDNYKNILKINPLGAIYRFASDPEHEGEPITAEAIIKAYGNMREDLTAFKQALPRLASEGYLKYNSKTFEIYPQTKLFTWVKAAIKKKDYDIIQLIGKVEDKENAVMDMSLNDLNVVMNGVQFFALSDSQFVRVVPKDKEVTLLKDRNMLFGGTMAVGKLNFYANEKDQLRFDYEGFGVHLDKIDSMRFILVRNPPEGFEFSPLQKALRNTSFEKVTGKIHLDDAGNKSGTRDDDGKTKNKYYPVLDTYEKSYVYWEKDNVQDGIYKKEKLFFALDPFVLDSLSGFDEKSLSFDGSFYSSDIFAEFRQQLVVMPDNSLGLRHKTEVFGLDVYKGKGKYFNEINMDNIGLHGNGKIEYLETTTESDTFVFHFDSCFAVTKKFDMRRSYHIPEVSGTKTKFDWYVKKDELKITTIDSPLKLFGGEATFVGVMTISPKGVIGNGTVSVDQVQITSDSIVFDEMNFATFDGTFAITDDDTLDLKHFIAERVNIKYDVLRHETNFESKENGVARAFFPIHRYRASLNKGTYNRRDKELKMEALSVYPLDNYFVSVSPEQDSLNFTAKEAYYKLANRNIEVRGVPVIIVADAIITPPDGNVTIYPDGFIRKIENATIEADKTSKQHKIYGAKVNIYSGKKYSGSGMYDYITVNGKPQYVKFDSIHVDQARQVTIATGDIPDEQSFYLTDRIRFRGDAELDASRKYMAFKGEVKIESDNEIFKGSWFSFPKTVVNPDSIFIPIEADLTDGNGNDLMVGLNFDKTNQVFYANFLQPKNAEDDLVILRAKGGLTVDRKTKEFIIGPEDKLKGKTYKGTVVKFDDVANVITSSGYFNNRFGDFYKGTLSPKIVGSWKDDIAKGTSSSNLVIGLDFPLPAEPMKKLVETIMFVTASMKDVNYSNRPFIESLSEFLDADNGGVEKTKLFEETQVKNAIVSHDIDVAKAVPSTLLLSGVNFNYNANQHALYCMQDVGVLGITGLTVNKNMHSKIVWQFGRESDLGIKDPDKLTVLLEVDNFNYIFVEIFEYTAKVYTSYMEDVNVPLEAAIKKEKPKSNEFHCQMGSADDVKAFRQMFKEKFVDGK